MNRATFFLMADIFTELVSVSEPRQTLVLGKSESKLMLIASASRHHTLVWFVFLHRIDTLRWPSTSLMLATQILQGITSIGIVSDCVRSLWKTTCRLGVCAWVLVDMKATTTVRPISYDDCVEDGLSTRSTCVSCGAVDQCGTDPDRSWRLSIIIMQVMPGSDYDVPFNMQCLDYCRGSFPCPMEVLTSKPVDT